MKKRRFRIIVPALAMVLTLGAAAVWLILRRPSLAGMRAGRDFNVILITLDTTRADRLGCYGFPNVETPAINGLASRGIRFDRCYAQTPLTLPSHTSIMTGTLPVFHGVRDNGGFLVPQQLKTMAELFKDKGFATGAFIAAYVLDSKWGLNQGFDTYFDKFDLSKFKRISLGTVQRPANEVLDEALPWLEKQKGGKFFTWIHLYDPHTPYEPPPPYDKLYAGHPYLGEIAFTDSQVGRVWQFLEANDLARSTFLVVAGDHGESLWEHEEAAHGFFVYQGAIHVPLIFVTPFARFQGRSSARVSTLTDILPTVCDLAGLPIPAEVQGRSLVPFFDRPKREDGALAYSETYYPRFHYGWSELKAVQSAKHKLILAPVPELYDLIEDPREQKNLVYLRKDVYEKLKAEAEAFIAASGRNAYETDYSKIDEETREKLAALGYIGSFADPAKLKGKTLGNPKEKIVVFNELSRAREMGLAGKPDEAIAIIQKIISSDPDIVDAYFSIGNICFQNQRFKEALGFFKQVLGRKPDDSFAVINVILSHEAMGEFDEAEKFALDYMAKGFEEPQIYFMLGNMSFLRKQYDKSVTYLDKALSLNAESAASHNLLAAIAIVRNDLEGAEEHLEQAQRLNPGLANIAYNKAQIAEIRGDLKEAEAEYLRELEKSSKYFKAMYNLARVYRMSGDDSKEYEYLMKCLEADPEFPLTYFYLARRYLNRGERYQEAIELVKKGIGLKPETAELPLGYFLLADLYNRVGDLVQSEEYARKGQAAAEAAAAAPKQK
jgi:arylsulfatase A-like enzyme/predicted Zn-dependent protease